MQGLTKTQASGIKDSQGSPRIIPKKIKDPRQGVTQDLKERDFQSQLAQANLAGFFPNSPGAMQQQRNSGFGIAEGQADTANVEGTHAEGTYAEGTYAEGTYAEGNDTEATHSEAANSSGARSMPGARSTAANPTATSSAESEIWDFKESAVKQPALKQSAVKDSVVKDSAVKQSAFKDSAVKNSALKELLASGTGILDGSGNGPDLDGASGASSLAPRAGIFTSSQDFLPWLLTSPEGGDRLGQKGSAAAPQNPTVTVSYSPIEKSSLTANPQFEVPDKLWFALAERVLKTNLSGSDFVNTLNSTKQWTAGLPGQLKEEPTGPFLGAELPSEPNGRGEDSLTSRGNSPVAALNTPNSPFSHPSIEGGLTLRQGIRELPSGKKDLSKELEKTLVVTTGHPGMNREAENSLSSPVLVSGNVTSGAMARERLSSESLNSLSTNIRGMSGQGGGEIRMRLRPDNLGELNIRVSTLGNRVELQIQASDERTKKIIEESIGYLKESLTSQNLSLANVDFSVAPQSPANSDPNSDPRSAHSQPGFQDALGEQGRRSTDFNQRGGGGSERSLFRDQEGLARPLISRLSASNGSQYSTSNLAKSGRIDVRG